MRPATYDVEIWSAGMEESSERRHVRLAGFFIGLTEVTNAQYAKFAAARKRAPHL